MGGHNAGRDGTARRGIQGASLRDGNRPDGIAEVRAVISEGAS